MHLHENIRHIAVILVLVLYSEYGVVLIKFKQNHPVSPKSYKINLKTNKRTKNNFKLIHFELVNELLP